MASEKPDFAALKAKRDAELKQVVEDICKEKGWDPAEVVFHASGCSGCYCACPDGPCEHDFQGSFPCGVEEGELAQCWSAKCTLCGAFAVDHDVRLAP